MYSSLLSVSWIVVRPSEQKKILCGQKHFAALGVDFAVSQRQDLQDLLVGDDGVVI